MSILGHHFIGGRRGACASINTLAGLDAVTGEAVRAAQIEEATS
ncbi:hypothetical protein PQR57_28120 [Paraburkholderia dipogonis]|jgi:hypothetical protein|uniref:Aldehyde dehydrogenase n=1 Tax=Paraburkholderia dipogonis TaxID=1211383 RepID=A0ABW9AY86_9BURK